MFIPISLRIVFHFIYRCVGIHIKLSYIFYLTRFPPNNSDSPMTYSMSVFLSLLPLLHLFLTVMFSFFVICLFVFAFILYYYYGDA